MKAKRHAARLRSFEIIATCGGVEIARCVVQALNEDEALIDGSDGLSLELGLGPCEDSVVFSAEPIDGARA